MMPRRGPEWRRNTPHSAGDRVSALIAEISIATLMVTANWRNNWPEMPGMKPIGTNTDSSTSVIAMIGPVICAIAFLVASLRRQIRLLLHHPLDVLHHHDRVVDDDADRQHHRQQGDGVGRVAERQQHREGADQADRHRDGRDDGGAQVAQEQEHHEHHQHERLGQRLDHLLDGVGDEGRAVVEDDLLQARPGSAVLEVVEQRLTRASRSDTALAPGAR